MKFKQVTFLTILVLFFIVPIGEAPGEDLLSGVRAFEGRAFKTLQDPDYLSYERALKGYLIQRIHKRFGIALDSKAYSGFDLLEIEAFFRCRKSNEPYEDFLKKFTKSS